MGFHRAVLVPDDVCDVGIGEEWWLDGWAYGGDGGIASAVCAMEGAGIKEEEAGEGIGDGQYYY